MGESGLFIRADSIIKRIAAIIDRDEALDKAFESDKDEIEREYQNEISALDSKRKQRIESVSAQDQFARANIRGALDALNKAEDMTPEKYKKNYQPTGLTPEQPDFQVLDELSEKITNGSFIGVLKRLTGIGGYASMQDMVNDYLRRIEAGRMYLRGEQQKGIRYLAQEKSAADAEYARGETAAYRKKDFQIRQKTKEYDQAEDALQNEWMAAINDPEFVQYDADLIDLLEQLGGFDDSWRVYEPSSSYPEQLMIGAITIPFPIPPVAAQMIQEKMPVAFSSGKGFCLPMTVDLSKPLQLLIYYDDCSKNEVMEGIQSIILKWIRSMPPYSFTLTYIDPNERGSNLGQLQKFEEIITWDLCKKVYASREDITRRLKELEKFVDATCARLAGVDSAYSYNLSSESPIVQHLIVINDFPEKMDRAAEESLDVLINNAAKCGISMIFTKNGDLSELPHAVQNSFLKINASGNGHTIAFAGKMYDFQFDTLCAACSTFIDKVKAVYNEGFKVDNSFAKFFSVTTFNGYRESTEALHIPFAVDSRKKLVELELGSSMSAHALLSGVIGSGKSSTLHMLITSIILNYHPDDVELWLVDYGKVEFAEYIVNRPPHVKLIGLERSAEFTFSLLKKVDEEFQRRMEMFKRAGVIDITEYKYKFGVRSLPRIIFIVDEFHQMTQAIQNEPYYTLILENMLAEYRKFGLVCVFSDQAMSVGLRGLTEKGRMQIRARIAMANDMSEIRETLSVDNSFYDDALRNKINHMDKGDVIFRRSIKNAAGEPQIIIDRYRTVYVTKEERAKSTELAKRNLRRAYAKQNVIIVDGKERKYCDESAIEKYEAVNGGPALSKIPIYLGTPANLNPCFCFSLQDRMDSNVMVIGADTEMRASIVLYTISCFSRISDYEIVVFADKKDELYTQFKTELESLCNEKIHIVTDAEEVCSYVNGLLEDAKNGNRPKTLMVWLGIESIGADLSMFPDKPKMRAEKTTADHAAIDNLMSELDSMIAEFDMPGDSNADQSRGKKKSSDHLAYDARDDISKLITMGSRFGIHSLVTCASVKMLRQSRFVKLESFEHKIAFSMSRDDWSNYLERIHYMDDLDRFSAVYYDGGSELHVFRPYLIK